MWWAAENFQYVNEGVRKKRGKNKSVASIKSVINYVGRAAER